MVSLPDRATAEQRVRRAGLSRVGIDSLSAAAVGALARLGAALDHDGDVIRSAIGAQAFGAWQDMNRYYLEAFSDGRLDYALVEAHP
jgi:hypothetical protein